MLLPAEYKILDRITLNGGKPLFRAERLADHKKIFLKISENIGSDEDDAGRIRKEHQIASELSCKGIPRFISLEKYNNNLVSTIADFDGLSLEKYIKEHRITIGEALKISINISEILEYLFAQRLLHRDLCPAHVLINAASLDVCIIDFSSACYLSDIQPIDETQNFILGSLPYISPEQTGRVKGDIDIRSDLYSLGIIMYQLFTGNVPFTETEALSLIHSHIAKKPLPPHVITPSMPTVVSDIIVKLLNKNVADRYQSPFGLRKDLENCLHQFESGGTIERFQTGNQDFSGVLQSSWQFFGREKELEILRHAYKNVSVGNVDVVMVEGYSGIGKSALVHSFKEYAQVQGAIFIESKFNQFQRNIPYYGFIQALKGFIDFTLTQNNEVLAHWRERILNAIGANGRLLTDIIPHLESIIGPQPEVVQLDPNENQNRFNYVFVNFIKCICQEDHPLVIFLDDLQWSDSASVNLLSMISSSREVTSLLFIGAYRQNELAANSAFSDALQKIEDEGRLLQKIDLLPLPLKNVAEIVYEILDEKVENGESLVNLIYDKSKGNPFFIIAFLKSLHAEDILSFNFYTHHWNWNRDKINQLIFTDNIVELMSGRIMRLPGPSQDLLKVAACLGYHFDVRLMIAVSNQTAEALDETLKPALDAGLIVKADNDYNFTHDRIQQAAYSLIPHEEKKHSHLRIGRSLLQNLNLPVRDQYIFEITDQLNDGFEAITGERERKELAELNLISGLKAKNSAAYNTSFEYLRTGISVLMPASWNNLYDLTVQLHTEGAESAFISGHTVEMEQWITEVLNHTPSVLEKVRVYELRIKFLIATYRQLEAIETAVKILKILDVRFPKHPNKWHVLFALVKIRLRLLTNRPAHLKERPIVTDPYMEAAIRILTSVGSAAYYAPPNLFALMVCKGFSLMVKYGNNPYSGMVCASYGMVILEGVRDMKAGYHWGKIAVELSEKFEASSVKCQTRMLTNAFFLHWKEHVKNTLKPLLNNYWFGLENGNVEFATYSALAYCYNSFFCGRNLKNLSEENTLFYERFQQLKHQSALNLHSIPSQAVLNLYELVDNPTTLTGKIYDEEKMIHFFKETKGEKALFKIYLYKLILAYLFEKYEELEQNAQETIKRIRGVSATPEIVIFYFYHTLALLTLMAGHPGSKRKKILRGVNDNLKLFRKFARLGPMNCGHKLLLIEAELYRVTGRPEMAASFYDKAISTAKENDYPGDVALSCELAGRFYDSQLRDSASRKYIKEAHRQYLQWSAFNKVRQLEQKYYYLREQQPAPTAINAGAAGIKPEGVQNDSSSETTLEELDLQTILKAAAAISGEVQLDKLLKALVRIAVENAGAEKGYLILKRETGLYIEAEGTTDLDEEVTVRSIPIKGNQSVSEAIVKFVYSTREDLVLDNAIGHPNLSADPIIQKNNSRSVLCLPIIHQGDVTGLLYLENNLITNAFTNDSIQLLKLLSGQMAVSLQNALNEQRKMNAVAEREKLIKQVNLHQQELLKTKLEIQEQTYQNISEELHDNIGQVLSVIKLNVNTIDLNETDKATEKLLESKTLLTKVIQDIRDLSKMLNTDFIEKIGLSNAIDQQLQLLKKTNLFATRFSVTGDPCTYESHRELVLFRIVQELLNNIVKHAGASTIDVVMDYKPDRLIITVQDDGKGFDVGGKTLSGKGLGLPNVKNRTKLIKGTIMLDSQPDKGTTATIELERQ